jgi:DNA-binding LytR/AlgR family response regulator
VQIGKQHFKSATGFYIIFDNMQKQYSCIVVDDEEVDRLTILQFVKQLPFLEVMGSFNNAEEALQHARTTPPDVLFLDIDMPGLNGLDLRRQLPAAPACIFITAYADYALDGFELEALDFIIKPVKSDRFDRMATRLQAYLELRHKAALLDVSLGGDTIFIKDGHEHIKIRLHDIIYLEALRDYTSIITLTKKYSVLATLANVLAQEAFRSFIRIHRSYAVQKHFINKVTAKEVLVRDFSLPIGRSYKQALESLIN